MAFPRIFRAPANAPVPVGPAPSVSPTNARPDPAWVTENLRPIANPKPTGQVGITIFMGQIIGEEQNADVRGRNWYGTVSKPGIADEMVRTDAHVRTSLQSTVNPVCNAIWDTPPASKSALAAEMAKFGRYNLFKVLPWKRFVRQAVTTAAKAGFSLFEPLTDIVEVPADEFPLHPSPVMDNGMKRVLMITALAPRLPRTVFRWMPNQSDPTRLWGVEQWVVADDSDPQGDTFRTLQCTRDNGAPGLIRFTHDEDGNNFEGLALIRSAYFAWKMKRALLLLEGIRHERQNLGLPSIKLPPSANDADRETAKKIAEAVRGHEKAHIVLPDGFTFEWNVSGQGQGTNVQQAIDRCDREIWMNVAAPFMLLGGNGDTGSYALAETMNDVRLLGLEALAEVLSEPFNSGHDTVAILPWLMASNYGEENARECPRLIAKNMPTRDWQKIVPQVLSGISTGAIRPDDPLEAHLRTVMLLPDMDPSTRRVPMMPERITDSLASPSGTPTQAPQPGQPSKKPAPAPNDGAKPAAPPPQESKNP